MLLVSITVETTEIRVSLPTKLLEELQRYVPNWQETQFLIGLLERELRRAQLKRAWEQSAGAWKSEDHPDLKTAEDVETYVRRLRDTALPRTWDEIITEDSDD
jgi:hypothetical protein